MWKYEGMYDKNLLFKKLLALKYDNKHRKLQGTNLTLLELYHKLDLLGTEKDINYDHDIGPIHYFQHVDSFALDSSEENMKYYRQRLLFICDWQPSIFIYHTWPRKKRYLIPRKDNPSYPPEFVQHIKPQIHSESL